MGDNKMQIELIRFFSAEILNAIEFMHSKKIVHRDIKPENIMINDDWHLKLVTIIFNL